MLTKVQSTNALDVLDEVRLLASVSGHVATSEQQIDLLWKVGHERFKNHIKFFVLKDTSAVVPRRKVKLLTFASSKKVKKNEAA